MALIVDTDTYVDLVYFNAYLATRYNSTEVAGLDDPTKEVLLKSAVRAIDLFCKSWKGYKNDEDQPLEFPRDGDSTPDAVKIAQCEVAIAIYVSGDVVDTKEPGLAKLKADVVEFIFDMPQGVRSLYNNFVVNLLSPYCVSYAAGSKLLTRV